jgi:beta-galactosidase
LLAPAGVRSELPDTARGVVELTVRRNADNRYLFLVNRTDGTVPLAGLSGELLVGSAGEDGFPVLSPRDVAVVRQPVR